MQRKVKQLGLLLMRLTCGVMLQMRLSGAMMLMQTTEQEQSLVVEVVGVVAVAALALAQQQKAVQCNSRRRRSWLALAWGKGKRSFAVLNLIP